MVTTIYGNSKLAYETVMTKGEHITSISMSMGGSDTSSAADKKRNKLGYHRTAIACGHCRRRKIRCIPPADPTSNRCQNCVRLKKDCQYYPVDQTTPTSTKKIRPDIKGDGMNMESENSVSSSSPGVTMGSMESYDPYRTSLESPGLSHGGGPYPPLGSANMMAPTETYGYPPQQYVGSPWQQQGGFPAGRYVDDRQSNDVQNDGYWPHTDSISHTPYDTSTFPTTAPDYHYSSQQVRDEQLANGTAVNSYGLYRSSAMSDGSDNQSAMDLRSQSMASASYSTTSPPPQYPPTPGLAPRWADTMQMQSTFAQQGGQHNWFGEGAIDSHTKNHGSNVLASHNGAQNQYRANPG